jgi:hypothetical protein
MGRRAILPLSPVSCASACRQLCGLRASLGDDVGTDLTSLDPAPYLGDPNVLFTFHYYDPFVFTGQGLSWLLDGRYRYLTGLTWPYDANNAQAELANALALIDQDSNLTRTCTPWAGAWLPTRAQSRPAKW